MSENELLEKIIQDIEDFKKNQATEHVSIAKLIHYLNAIKRDTVINSQQIDRLHDKALKELEIDNQSEIELFRSVIESAKDALRAALIISGGAVVSLLTMIGNLGIEKFKLLSAGLSYSLLMFSVSVAWVLSSYFFRYLSQAFFGERRDRAGDWFKYLAIAAAILSFAFLIAGIFFTYDSLSRKF